MDRPLPIPSEEHAPAVQLSPPQVAPPLPQPPAKHPVELPTLDFLGLFQVLARKKWLILLVLACSMGSAVLFANYSPEVFEATGELEVKSEDRQVRPDTIPKENLGSIDALKTVERNLQSTSLVKRMIEKRDLGSSLKGSLASQISQIHGNSSIQLVRGTRNVTISYRSHDAEFATRVVNAYIDEFLQVGLENKKRLEEDAIASLAERATHFRQQLGEATAALDLFTKEHETLDLRTTSNIIGDALSNVHLKAAEATANRIDLENKLKSAASTSDPADLLEISIIAQMPNIQRLNSLLHEKEAAFETVKKTFGPKHPQYRSAQSEVQAFQSSLEQAARAAFKRLELDYHSAQESENAFRLDLESKREQVAKREEIVNQYEKLKNDVDHLQGILTEVTAMKRRTEINAGLDTQLINVIERPMVQEYPIWPNKPFILAGGLLGGIVCGLALAFALEALRTRVRDEADVAKLLPGVPCLATLPSVKQRKPKDKLVLLRDPHSVAAEGFRKLRTALFFQDRIEPRITLIASANANDGKSYTAMNCAAAYAMQGYQTLLIDADLRCPSLENVFLKGRNRGMTEFLRGRAEPHDICYPTEVTGLYFIPAGDLRPNPSELLAGPRLAELLTQASHYFDRIVIDSAPLVPVSDGLTLAPYANATCLVVRSNTTKKKDLVQVEKILGKISHSVTGYVLNDAPPREVESTYVTYMSKQQRLNLKAKDQETPALPARTQDLSHKVATL